MPAPKVDEAAEQAEFAALVAELEAPEGDEETEDEPEEKPPADEETEDEPEDDEADEDEELEDDAEELNAEETAAKALFEAGDIKAACKKLGIDPKIFKISQRDFTAMRKGLKEAKTLREQGTSAKQAGEKLHKDAEHIYGPIVAGFKAYRDGDFMSVRSAIELMAEDTFENVVAKAARAAKGLDPAQVEVLKLRKELKEREDKAKEEQTTAQAKAQQAAEVKGLEGKLKTTPLAKVPGAAQEIYDLVRASYDGTGYAVSVKEAYAQVKDKYAKLAAGFGKALPAAKKGKDGKKLEELAPIRKDVSKMTPAEKRKAKEDEERAEFEAVLRASKEDVRKSERSARRASNGKR